MIIDKLSNSRLYARLNESIQAAFVYLERTDLNTLSIGRHEIDGQQMYAMLQEYETKPRNRGIWEAHRRYIDLQVMLQGAEKIGYANIAHLTQGVYDPAKDYFPLSGEGDFLTLKIGCFMLLFPEDGHMPGIELELPQSVKKIVIKIAV
jgi:biofilm protein TabA